MTIKVSYSVSALIRKDKMKVNGECPLYLQIILNSKKLKIPLGVSESEKDWDNVKKRFKGKGYLSLNSRLDKEEQKIKDFINQTISAGHTISLEKIKNYVSQKNLHDFFTFFEKIFCERKFQDIEEGTQYHYKLLGKILKEFRPNLSLQDIDLNFIQEFDYYLKESRKTGDGGVWNKHKNLKSVILLAKKLKYIEYNPYDDFKFTAPKSKTHFLNHNEVEKIKNLELNESLDLTRDKFLLACYTGLRFSDINRITRKNWGGVTGTVHIEMQKTKEMISVPLANNALKIILKHQQFKKNDEPIFRGVSNQKVNDMLKVIAEKAGVNPKLSFHWARHTFGSLLAQNGLNAFEIMKLLGHKDLKQSLIYVNSTDAMLKEKIKDIEFFNK